MNTIRLFVAAMFVGWIGLLLMLSRARWFSRPSLADRLRPYSPGGMGAAPRNGILSVASFRDVIAPLAQRFGTTVSRLFGVGEELDARLRRFHSPLVVAEFRTRQLAWSLVCFGISLMVAIATGMPVPIGLLMVFGAPLLAFLLLEQQVDGKAQKWQRRLFLELPVVTEQLGMLLSAGYSLGTALNRLAGRSQGAVAQDLRRVCGRIRQGLSEQAALQEWAELARVDALDRLVSVLALNREAGDLGDLISAEARAIRADAHRELIETIEKRNQMVWIPVTVAALLPGVMFIAIPFLDVVTVISEMK